MGDNVGASPHGDEFPRLGFLSLAMSKVRMRSLGEKVRSWTGWSKWALACTLWDSLCYKESYWSSLRCYSWRKHCSKGVVFGRISKIV